MRDQNSFPISDKSWNQITNLNNYKKLESTYNEYSLQIVFVHRKDHKTLSSAENFQQSWKLTRSESSSYHLYSSPHAWKESAQNLLSLRIQLTTTMRASKYTPTPDKKSSIVQPYLCIGSVYGESVWITQLPSFLQLGLLFHFQVQLLSHFCPHHFSWRPTSYNISFSTIWTVWGPVSTKQ